MRLAFHPRLNVPTLVHCETPELCGLSLRGLDVL